MYKFKELVEIVCAGKNLSVNSGLCLQSVIKMPQVLLKYMTEDGQPVS